MSELMWKYIQEDIDELERLKKRIPPDKDISLELIDYKDQFQLFLTTLKIAVNNGTLSEADAAELRRKYSQV